jgi:hypothetical protein
VTRGVKVRDFGFKDGGGSSEAEGWRECEREGERECCGEYVSDLDLDRDRDPDLERLDLW